MSYNLFKLTEKRILSTPPIIYLVVLFLIPTLIMIFIAFREPGEYGGVAPLIQHIGKSVTKINLTFDSFKFALTSEFIWQLCLRSVKYSLITTFCCLMLGYPLASLIAKSQKKHRDVLLLLVIIPFWSCFLIRIYAWMIILGPQSGVSHIINVIIGLFGYQPANLLYSSFAVIVCLVYINLPFMVLPLYANLEKHDEAIIEASRDLGATRLQSFLQITIPLSLPGILAGSALVFIPSIGMFVVPELVGNNCSLMIGNLIKQQFLQTMNWPLGSVTAIIMTLIVLGISLLVGSIARRTGGLKYATK
ncbi:MAG: ABC transporter permease [Proteobacteria bacterium]|jgi:spermidine/putrescine transport system permease protein|nr:ABC transporter permease [Pseudomonadota bacterium]